MLEAGSSHLGNVVGKIVVGRGVLHGEGELSVGGEFHPDSGHGGRWRPESDVVRRLPRAKTKTKTKGTPDGRNDTRGRSRAINTMGQ